MAFLQLLPNYTFNNKLNIMNLYKAQLELN